MQHRLAASALRDGEGSEAELRQLMQLVEARTLARVPWYKDFRVAHDWSSHVYPRSVVPVFPPGEEGDGYVAFVVDYVKHLWEEIDSGRADLSCSSSEKPGFVSKLEAYGAEYKEGGRWSMVLKCAWPRELRSRPCQTVDWLGRHGQKVHSFEACHEPALAQEGPYEVAACLEPLRENSSLLDSSGIMQLPQWLEYNVQKGVEHFVIYTLNETDSRQYMAMKPFLEANMVTLVHLDVPYCRSHGGQKTQQLVINDCLHRMRGRAKWLTTSVDVDEYVVFNTSDRTREMKFAESLAEVADDVYGVMFTRRNFLHPKKPYEELQISSQYRQLKQPSMGPKCFIRPDLVNALFVHWPMSWINGTRMLLYPPQDLLALHYRVTTTNLSEGVLDTTMGHSDVLALDGHFARRYGQPWATFARRLVPTGEATAPAATMAECAASGRVTMNNHRRLAGQKASLLGAGDWGAAEEPGVSLYSAYLDGLDSPTYLEGGAEVF